MVNFYEWTDFDSRMESWPAFEDVPNIKVLSGMPVQSGRIDWGSIEGPLAAGVWKCTPGKLRITYAFSEFCSVLNGSVAITNAAGTTKTVAAGGSFFTPQGEVLTWEITETITKAFLLHVGTTIVATRASDLTGC